MKKFVFKHKTGKMYKDKRGYLLNILDKGFSSCIEIYSKKKLLEQIIIIRKTSILHIFLKEKFYFFIEIEKKMRN